MANQSRWASIWAIIVNASRLLVGLNSNSETTGVDVNEAPAVNAAIEAVDDAIQQQKENQ